MDSAIPELNKDGLRRFAFSVAGFLALVFGCVLPMLFNRPYPLWPWIVSVVLIVWGGLMPARLRVFYQGWMSLALALGRFNSGVLLCVLFVIIIVPLGMLLRRFGYDPLRLAWQPSNKTYRKYSEIRSSNHMEGPY